MCACVCVEKERKGGVYVCTDRLGTETEVCSFVARVKKLCHSARRVCRGNGKDETVSLGVQTLT